MDPDFLRTLLNEQLGKELDLLSQRVKAEQDTANELRRKNDLEEQALRSVERNRQAEVQKVQLWLSISEQTANLVQQLPEFKLTILAQGDKLEQLFDISERLDRIERAILLLMSKQENSRQAKELVKEIEDESSKRRILEKKRRNLNLLKEQLAAYGIDKPPKLIMEIEDLEIEIEALENES